MLSAPNSGCPHSEYSSYLCQGKNAPLWAWRYLLVQGRLTSCRAYWSTWLWKWVCHQFSSFCLGWDGNPSSFNTTVHLQKSCMGSLGQSNQLLTLPSHWMWQMDFNAVDDFVSGLSQQCLWVGKQQWQVLWGEPCSVPTAMYSLLITLRTPKRHLGMPPSPWHP